MATKIGICNMAISYVGGQIINSLEYPYESKEAEVCDLFFDQALTEVLRNFAWGFATATIQLTRLTSENQLGFSFTYALPQDCVRVLEIVNPTPPGKVNYELSFDSTSNSRVLLSNKSPAVLKYTKKITNYELADGAFISALSYLLSSFIAVPLLGATAGSSVSVNLLNIYTNFLQKAGVVSHNERDSVRGVDQSRELNLTNNSGE